MKKIFCIVVSMSVLLLIGCKENDIKKPVSLKLDYYTESYDMTGIGIQTSLKVQYEYDASGVLSRYTVFGYNAQSGIYEKERYLVFTYSNGRVDKVEGYLVDASTPYVRDVYQYQQDNRVSKIIENNFAAVLNSEANFIYNAADESVKVNYTYSNGQGFEYEFSYRDNDIQNDKTTRGPELCNNGLYTYDHMISPFNKLGYVDYQLLNFSANNKLTENVNYVSCAFPALIPESYTYEYNEQGYPTVAVTSYKNSQMKSHRNFYYKAN